MKIGIYNETDPLKTAVTWGPLGTEAVLAQFYPHKISLFLDDMNVIKARDEALFFAEKLNSYGVTTFFARDILAEIIKPTPINFNTIFSILVQKAEDTKAKFKTKNHKNYKEIIEILLKLDTERYGEVRAYNLNWKLSLYPFLPLGNLIYSRDQMNVILSKRVRSHMKKEIRKPEVELYELVYEKIFNSRNHSISIPLKETFEGGDAYIHDKMIFVGVGARTSMGAAISIFENLNHEIKKGEYKFVVVEDRNPKRSLKEQMLFMHLDTFSNPIGRNQIAVCLEEARNRKIKLLEISNSKTKIIDTKKTMLDFLFESGQEIVAIPKSEQQAFGCNFLSVNNNTVMVPLKTNKKTIEEFKNLGKKIEYVNLEESTKGFGAAHCMTGQLYRKYSS